MRFTERSIKALKPREKRYELFGDGRKGLGIRVAPSGRKSWIFVYRRNGKLSRITLGTYPDDTLADAHSTHSGLRDLLRAGTDPAMARRLEKHLNVTAPSVADLADLYLERHAKPMKRSWREDQRILDKDVLSRWGETKAKDIKRRDVIALLDDIVDRGSPIAANNTLAVIRKMFNFAIERSILEDTPCRAVKAPGKTVARDRVLSDTEIKTFWTALDGAKMTLRSQLVLKLILVTAQRKGEILNAEKSEFDLDNCLWTIPSERSKNKLAHRVPLTLLAMDLLEEARNQSGDSRYLFPSPRGDKPMLGSAVSRAILNNRELFAIDQFTPHDLRRTTASHMTSIGISRLVVAKILNHAEGGVTAIYDRHGYDKEKRQALIAWGRRLDSILAGETGRKVFELVQEAS